MAKEVRAVMKLQVPAGKATPGQALAALSQNGLNIMEFCKAFNAKTQQMKANMPIPVIITAYKDRTFSFQMKKPPVSYFLKETLGLKKGSSETGRTAPVGKITPAQIEEIAKEKMTDLNAHTLEAACSMIRGSARAMGLEVLEGA